MPIAMQDFLNSSRLARRILRLDLTGWTKTRFDTNLTRQSAISLNNAKTITAEACQDRDDCKPMLFIGGDGQVLVRKAHPINDSMLSMKGDLCCHVTC